MPGIDIGNLSVNQLGYKQTTKTWISILDQPFTVTKNTIHMNVWVSKSYEQKDTQQLLKLGLMSEKQKKKNP